MPRRRLSASGTGSALLKGGMSTENDAIVANRMMPRRRTCSCIYVVCHRFGHWSRTVKSQLHVRSAFAPNRQRRPSPGRRRWRDPASSERNLGEVTGLPRAQARLSLFPTHAGCQGPPPFPPPPPLRRLHSGRPCFGLVILSVDTRSRCSCSALEFVLVHLPYISVS